MSDYAEKLSSLSQKKHKLLQEEAQLIDKRKKEIGELAEKFGLLVASDGVLSGLFLEAQTALHDKSDKLKTWESHGATLISQKKLKLFTPQSTQPKHHSGAIDAGAV